MTKVLENGQLEWILEASEEKLEKELVILRKQIAVVLDNHQAALDSGNFGAAHLLINTASDLLLVHRKISDELIARIWDGEI
jgi:hypothetical protein